MLPAFEQDLHSAGLRVTAPRLGVLEVLTARPHLEPDEVRRRMTQRGIRASVQTVYDVLNALTAAGLLRRVEPAGSIPRYEIDHHDNHHHLVCRECKLLVDVECPADARPCVDPVETYGFVIDAAEVLYWGLCPQCQSREHATTTSSTEKGSR